MSNLRINNLSEDVALDQNDLAAIYGGHSPFYFDEADALFGNRSEVKHSDDRYSINEPRFLAIWL